MRKIWVVTGVGFFGFVLGLTSAEAQHSACRDIAENPRPSEIGACLEELKAEVEATEQNRQKTLAQIVEALLANDEFIAEVAPEKGQPPSADDVAAALVQNPTFVGLLTEERLNVPNALAIDADDASVDTALTRLLPPGAVVAFDRPDGCGSLTGWEPFSPGAGRFIIGVGNGYQLPYFDDVPQYQTDGQATVPNKIRQSAQERPPNPTEIQRYYESRNIQNDLAVDIPPDTKDYEITTNPGDLRTVPQELRRLPPWLVYWSSVADNTDSDAHQNNMPPYIALYFCKKL